MIPSLLPHYYGHRSPMNSNEGCYTRSTASDEDTGARRVFYFYVCETEHGGAIRFLRRRSYNHNRWDTTLEVRSIQNEAVKNKDT